MAILEPFDKRLLAQSLRHCVIVLAFFVFAVALDMSIHFFETRKLLSSQILDGMEETALFIFFTDRFMIYYMVAMAAFRLMLEFTIRLWNKPL